MKRQEQEQGRRTRKRLQMLALLANTSATLFEEHGYDAVTMEQIAAAADVAKRTLYNHFPTKEAVLAYWLDAQLDRDLAGLQDKLAQHCDFRGQVDCVLDASAQWCEKHPVVLKAYLQYRLMNAGTGAAEQASSGKGDISAAWYQLIAHGQNTGELDDALCPERLATWFHHLYLGAVLRWLSNPGLSLRSELVSITDLFLNGARPLRAAGRAGR